MTVRVLALVSLSALLSCELVIPLGSLPPDSVTLRAIDGTGPIDILVVVDNSASMSEEQVALSQALFRDGCPIQGLTNVPERLRNPTGDVLLELEQLCGIAQILAAYDRDFRVGVITTDVNACDNFLPEVQGGEERGFTPQRGCLQRVPSTGQRFIDRDDVEVADKFVDLMSAIGTFGSPFERGLDAVDALLGGDTFDSTCIGDGASFRREGASLLVMFATDEDDCSHRDGASGFSDETLEACGRDERIVSEHNPADCYVRVDELEPVASYAERWQALVGEAGLRVLVVGGAVPIDDVNFGASGCVATEAGIDGTCFESGGLSNFTGAGQFCGPELEAERGGLPCCTAEAAARYQELVSIVDGSVQSICDANFVGAVVSALH